MLPLYGGGAATGQLQCILFDGFDVKRGLWRATNVMYRARALPKMITYLYIFVETVLSIVMLWSLVLE